MKKTLGLKVTALLLTAALLAGIAPFGEALAAPKRESKGNTEEFTEEALKDTEEFSEEEGCPEEAGEEGLPAQEEGTDELLVLMDGFDNAGEPLRTPPEHAETGYVRDVFFSQAVLKGILSAGDLYFYIPEYWETEYVYVELEYRVSQLIKEPSSSLTFSVNQVPVSSCKIAYEGGDAQLAFVEVPVDMLKQGYNSFTITAYAKLYDEGGCADDFSDANWLSISDNSYIRCGYEVKDHEYKISCYPYPFLSTCKETGEGLTIAVSDQAADGEVAAAMNLMADLSGQTESENKIRFTLLSDIPKGKTDRTILVSEYNNLPAAYQDKVENKSALEDHGVVVFTDDEKGNPLLIITSKEEKCLLEAAYMLMDEERVCQERGSTARVMQGSADIAVGRSGLSKAAGNYTLSDLAGGGLSFTGPFHQEQVIYLPFSEDYYLADAGKVTLNFRYSENLDFNRSLVTVYWGNVPIASRKLDKDRASGDELTFTMPSDVVGTAAGSIKIAFDLEVQDMFCTPRQDQMPWAYVAEQSSFYLPASSDNKLSFDLLPSPFRMDGKFHDTLLVISDRPDSEELELYAQLVGMYGDGLVPYGTLMVKRAGEFSKEDGDYNIITAGTYEGNSLIRELNESLPFSYNSTGKSFESNGQLILSGDYAERIAILQLLQSPYGTNRGILAVTGASKESLSNVEELLRDAGQRAALTKDCVIVEENLETRAFRFIVENADRKEPTLAETVAQNKQSVLFTIVATSVMLMLLIAVIIILIRIKTYHRKKDEE